MRCKECEIGALKIIGMCDGSGGPMVECVNPECGEVYGVEPDGLHMGGEEWVYARMIENGDMEPFMTEDRELDYSKIIDKVKGCLLEYKGGGYDGCYWEYNYAYFSKEGGFYNIYAAGINGIDSMEGILKELQFQFRSSDNGGEIFDIYNFQDEDELLRFTNHTDMVMVKGIGRYLSENVAGDEVILYSECAHCEEKVPVDDLIIDKDSYRGGGGIGVIYDTWLCSKCIEDLTCKCCRELGSEELVIGLCINCWDEFFIRWGFNKYDDEDVNSLLEGTRHIYPPAGEHPYKIDFEDSDIFYTEKMIGEVPIKVTVFLERYSELAFMSVRYNSEVIFKKEYSFPSEAYEILADMNKIKNKLNSQKTLEV